MKSPKATYFYVLNLDRMLAGESGRKLPPIQGASVDFQGLPGGQYAAEFWDPYVGEVVATSPVAVAGGVAHVVLPDFLSDLACKMRLQG